MPIAAESINMLFEAVVNFFGFGKADSAAIIPPNSMDITPITVAAINTFVESNSDKIAIIRPIPFMADPSVFIINDAAKILFGSIPVPNLAKSITKAPIKIVMAPITAAAISTFVESNSDKIAIIRPIPFIADPIAFIINAVAKMLFGSILFSPNLAKSITKAPIKTIISPTIPIAVATAPILFTALIIVIKAPIANKILLIEEPNAARRSAIAAKREETLSLSLVAASRRANIKAIAAIRADKAKTEGHNALESILDTTNKAAAIIPIPIAKFLKDLLISLFATESIAFLIDVVIPFTALVNDSRPLLIDLNISKDLPALIPINTFTKSLMSSTTLSAPKNSRILSLNGIRF